MTLRERIDRLRDVPPLSTCSPADLRELYEEVEAAESLDDLPGRWQAAILEAETVLQGG